MMLEMEKTKIARLMLMVAFLGVTSKSNGQLKPNPGFPAPRPLCLSQFVLVNHACAVVPYSPVPPPSPPSPPSPSAPPPTPPAPSNGHRHGHHHRHRHDGGSHSPVEEQCCRWLKEVDTQCVCDLLVRLPVFLSKPTHNYTVTVTEDCSVTYQCPGRVIS